MANPPVKGGFAPHDLKGTVTLLTLRIRLRGAIDILIDGRRIEGLVQRYIHGSLI